MINNSDLVKLVARETGYASANVKEILDTLYDIIEDKLKSGEETIRFGRFIFETKIVQPRQVKNFITGEFFEKPAHLKCWVKPNTLLKRDFQKIELK